MHVRKTTIATFAAIAALVITAALAIEVYPSVTPVSAQGNQTMAGGGNATAGGGGNATSSAAGSSNMTSSGNATK